jgi:hypothetical protein
VLGQAVSLQQRPEVAAIGDALADAELTVGELIEAIGETAAAARRLAAAGVAGPPDARVFSPELGGPRLWNPLTPLPAGLGRWRVMGQPGAVHVAGLAGAQMVNPSTRTPATGAMYISG